jgi:hypothetical protein
VFIIRAAPLAAVLLIAACNTPTATIKAGDLPDDQARTYLIFADQLQRVRIIL